MLLRLILLLSCIALADPVSAADVVQTHPRIFITQADLPELAKRCAGPLAEDYARAKRDADNAVRSGTIRWLNNAYSTPSDLMACGLAYLVERQAGRPHQQYADLLIRTWSTDGMLSNQKNCHFGYHAIAYDWIYDALDDSQRQRFGDALGAWLTWFTGKAEITLQAGHWEYNQTWGPSHLNVMHSRDAITQKLLISLAILGAGTAHEAKAKQFLDSWALRIPRDCIPAFDAMGGSWAESHGHGGYGPNSVVPYSFEAWRTATGQNLFTAGKPWSFLPEQSRWLTYLLVPHVERHAYIDDGGGSRFSGFANAAPISARALRDPLAQWHAQEAVTHNAYQYESWVRPTLLDPSVAPRTPGELKLPLAHLFSGAGHVFMRSAWDDPNATWAFFGVGPHIAGHQHDDEGHFMISRRGGLVSKAGGKGGGNDSDHHWGGSLIFNILTIFDPAEKMRRTDKNENDGGLLRHVYENKRIERGSIQAYQHHEFFTYAAADLTPAYSPAKAKGVSRQFLYLRGKPGVDEYFVVFDRVASTKAEFAKHFMLHMPSEPTVSGTATELVPGHVSSHASEDLISSWLSLPEDFGDKTPVLSSGRSRIFMKTLLPADAVITKRGGKGHATWGHPLEPSAQYDHIFANNVREQPPICPWRLEVAAPLSEATLFLHVFQVADEGVTRMAPVVLTRQGGTVSVAIGTGNTTWAVTLDVNGEAGGTVTPPREKKAIRLANEIQTDAQYGHWNEVVGTPAKPRRR